MGNNGFIAVLKLVFFMVYYPLLGLFYFFRWLIEAARNAQSAEQTRQYQAQNTTWEQQREIERRKRNTLYNQEPESAKQIETAPMLPYTAIIRAVRDRSKRNHPIRFTNRESCLFSLLLGAIAIPILLHFGMHPSVINVSVAAPSWDTAGPVLAQTLTKQFPEYYFHCQLTDRATGKPRMP